MMVLKSTLVLGCATALAAAGDVPCPTETAFPWCDTKLPRAERVASLVANLSKAEKSTLFTNGASAVDRIHWPKYNWWSEALHGVARDGLGTSFPQIGLVAASYNRTLWHAIGDVTSTEGRGKNNKLQGGMYQGLTFWAPNVNIFRDRTLLQINTIRTTPWNLTGCVAGVVWYSALGSWRRNTRCAALHVLLVDHRRKPLTPRFLHVVQARTRQSMGSMQRRSSPACKGISQVGT
jgi:hypothetical protein